MTPRMNGYSTYTGVCLNSVCDTEWVFKFIVAEKAMLCLNC